MSTELHESLTAAANTGRASFELRDADEVIQPAARRIRRQRAAIVTTGTVGLFALAGGLVWSAQTFGTVATMDPAGTPSVQGTAVAAPWSALQFAPAAQPRKIGDANRSSAVKGMICHHDEPEDDPRVAIQGNPDTTVSSAIGLESCAPVWYSAGPTSTSNFESFSVDDDHTISAHVRFTNTSSRPLAIDVDSVVMWVETAPNEVSKHSVTAYSSAIVGDSMWETATSNVMLLNSRDQVEVVEPGEDFAAAAVVSDYALSGSVLGDIIASREPYTVSFWARVHEDDPSGHSTYMVELGSPITVDVSTTGR
ncbi:MAG: hypothetical protein NVV57_09555 [Demequina sp.]|nr:hypothetical protein [Demequina sp.]